MKLLKNIVLNLILGLNVFILFFLLFEQRIVVPAALQVVGRLHPLLLHFPIVLLLLALVFELFDRQLSADDRIPATGPRPAGGSALPKRAVGLLLYAGALSAALTVAFGLLLSKEEGYGGSTMDWHKWTGIAIAFISALLLWYQQRRRVHAGLLRAGMALTCLILLIAGHLGAALTHGEGFVLQPVRSNEKPAVNLARAVVFPDLVMPILDEKCLSCHNTGKAKGELILTDSASFLAGGKDGALLPPPGDTTGGLLLERLLLDLEHEHHMPPKGKPQLSAEELALIQAWVRSGGSFSRPLAVHPPNDTIHALAKAVYGASGEDEESFDFPAASESTIAGLNNDYRVIAPLAGGSPALDVSLFNKAAFNERSIGELKAIGEQIVYLNVSGMPLQAEDFQLISQFRNLRQLNLNYTPTGDQQLQQLSDLPQLRSLMLTGTAISPAGIDAIAQMDRLEHIYAWNTEISPEQARQWTGPGSPLHIETGYYADDSTLLALNLPQILPERTYFKDSVQVSLEHSIKGTLLCYTLDGSEPGSLQSLRYQQPFMLTGNTMIKVKAFKEGWTPSATAQKLFYRSRLKPDDVRLTGEPTPRFKGRGATALFDMESGGDHHADGKWQGYIRTALSAGLYFDEPTTIDTLLLSVMQNYAGITAMPVYAPEYIEIWGGKDEASAQLLAKITPPLPQPGQAQRRRLIACPVQREGLRYLRLVAQPYRKVPDGFPREGAEAWLFIDEVVLK